MRWRARQYRRSCGGRGVDPSYSELLGIGKIDESHKAATVNGLPQPSSSFVRRKTPEAARPSLGWLDGCIRHDLHVHEVNRRSVFDPHKDAAIRIVMRLHSSKTAICKPSRHLIQEAGGHEQVYIGPRVRPPCHIAECCGRRKRPQRRLYVPNSPRSAGGCSPFFSQRGLPTRIAC